MTAQGPTIERMEEFEVRLYKMTTVSHLAVGSGEGGSLSPVDKPLMRASIMGKDEPLIYIPGSSIHGVMRSWVEKAIRSIEGSTLDVEENFKTFMGQESTKVLAEQLKAKAAKELEVEGEGLFENWRLYRRVCNIFWEHDKCEPLKSEDAPSFKEAWLNHIGRQVPCDVCKIFGHTGLRGRVRFTAAYPSKKGSPVDIITRVAIDRLTGAASPGKLFDLEAIVPGVEFFFYTVMENMKDGQDDKAHFEYGVKALQMNLATIGSNSTVGFGQVELEELRRVVVKPGIFKLEKNIEDFLSGMVEKEKIDENYPEERFPRFFNLLRRLDKGGLPQYVAETMVEVKK